MNTYILISCVEETLEFALTVKAVNIFEAVEKFDYYPDSPALINQAKNDIKRWDRKTSKVDPSIMSEVKKLVLQRYGIDLDSQKIVPVSNDHYSEYHILEVTAGGDVNRYPDTKRGSHKLGKVKEANEKFWSGTRNKKIKEGTN